MFPPHALIQTDGGPGAHFSHSRYRTPELFLPAKRGETSCNFPLFAPSSPTPFQPLFNFKHYWICKLSFELKRAGFSSSVIRVRIKRNIRWENSPNFPDAGNPARFSRLPFFGVFPAESGPDFNAIIALFMHSSLSFGSPSLFEGWLKVLGRRGRCYIDFSRRPSG